MKVFRCVLTLMFCGLLLQVQAQERHEYEEIIRAESRRFSADKFNTRLTRQSSIDVTYQSLHWKVDPRVRYIQGEVLLAFDLSQASQEIRLDLHDDLQVDSVLHKGVDLVFTHTVAHELVVQLPAVLDAGVSDTLVVFYQGVPPEDEGLRSFELDVHGEEEVPILWTLSEPYGAQDWWPCHQDLNDKIDSIDVWVETPQPYKVASNGLLVEETYVDTMGVFHWKHRYPIPAYLVAIAVTDYARYSDWVTLESGVLEVQNYVFKEDSAEAADKTDGIVEIFEVFDSLFGPYPFLREQYGHAQFGWGGGMEHQTMSFMGNFSHHLMAHELAHQWFGNKVTCGSWKDLWLNEGFATYLTGLSYEHMFDGRYWEPWKQNKVDWVTEEPGGSVYLFDDTLSLERVFDARLTYYKGSMLLHMLRWKMGDDRFYQALKNYLDDADLAYGYVLYSDLQSHLEAVGGEDLTEYFQDWLFGEGFPTYEVSWTQFEGQLNITLDQSTSVPSSVDFFEMPVPLQIKGADRDTLIRLDHRFSGEQFAVDVPWLVDEVVFDPDIWLLAGNNTSVGIKEFRSDQFNAVLYPSIAQHVVHLKIQGAGPLKGGIEVYSLSGQVVLKQEAYTTGDPLHVASLSNGEYLLRFVSDSKVYQQKFQVHK